VSFTPEMPLEIVLYYGVDDALVPFRAFRAASGAVLVDSPNTSSVATQPCLLRSSSETALLEAVAVRGARSRVPQDAVSSANARNVSISLPPRSKFHIRA